MRGRLGGRLEIGSFFIQVCEKGTSGPECRPEVDVTQGGRKLYSQLLVSGLLLSKQNIWHMIRSLLL